MKTTCFSLHLFNVNKKFPVISISGFLIISFPPILLHYLHLIRTINILYLSNTYLSITYNMASAIILETWATQDKTDRVSTHMDLSLK